MNLIELLRLNLQFFSQDDEGGSNPGDEETPSDDENEDDEEEIEDEKEPKFTQDEVDKIVKERLARAEADKEKAIKEAKKLAKMNEDQKKEYELEKLRKENEKLKAANNRYELGQEATKILAKSGIVADDDVLNFVVKEDAEKTNEAIKTFTSLVDRISDEKMKEKLKGKAPIKSAKSSGVGNPFRKENWNLTQQGKLIRDNPDQAKQLMLQAGVNPANYEL